MQGPNTVVPTRKPRGQDSNPPDLAALTSLEAQSRRAFQAKDVVKGIVCVGLVRSHATIYNSI